MALPHEPKNIYSSFAFDFIATPNHKPKQQFAKQPQIKLFTIIKQQLGFQ